MQRSSQGSHLPLPRRARKAVRSGGRANRGAAASAEAASSWSRRKSRGKASLVHRFSEPAAERSDRRSEKGRRNRAGKTRPLVGRAGAGSAERIADRGRGGRYQAAGDSSSGQQRA